MASRQNEALQAYNASAWGSITITPSDTTILSPVLRAIYVGAAGNVAVRMLDGSTPIFVGVLAGTVLPIQIDKVLATGTTAASIVGLY